MLKGGSEGAKIFESVEAMNASENNELGDLAVVYVDSKKNATADSRFSKAVFPETVVLPTAMTDYADIMYRAVDDSVMFECWGQLDSSYFMMDCYTETGNISIEYMSNDGITYTRTRLEGDGVDGDSVDFGVEIYYARSEMWNDAIGCFIQLGSSSFEGLFQYLADTDASYIVSDKGNKVYFPKVNLLCDRSDGYGGGNSWSFVDYTVMEVTSVDADGRFLTGVYYKALNQDFYVENGTIYGFKNSYANCDSCEVAINWDARILYRTSDWRSIRMTNDVTALGSTTTAEFLHSCTQYTDSSKSTVKVNGRDYEYDLKYMTAQTQFTATESTVLPGIVAYGSTGVVTGDETVYHSFPLLDYLTSFGADPWNDGTVIITNKNDTSKIGEITLGEDYTAKFKNITANIWNDASSIFPIGDYYVLSRESTPTIELYNRELTLLSSYTIPDITRVYQILRAHLEGDVVHLFIGAQDFDHVAVVDMPLEGGAVGVSVSSETWRSVESYIYTNDAWYVLLGGAFYKYSVGTQPKLLYTFRSGTNSYNDYGMCQCGNDLYALFGYCGNSSYNWVGPTYIVKLDLATDECVLYKEYSTRAQLTSNGYVATTTGVCHVTDLDTVLNADVTSVNHTYPNTLYDPTTGYFWTCGVEFFVSKTGANWAGDLLLRPNEALYKHFYGTIYPDNVTVTSMDVDFTHMFEYKVSQVCAIADNSDNSMLHVYRIDVDYKNGSSVEGSSVAPLHDVTVANAYLPIE